MPQFDVIVVGLGAMGSAATAQLARRGKRVLGLEAFSPGHRLGSSHGESRIIRLAYYEHPNYVPLLHRAYELWDELEDQSGAELLTITGGLMIGAPESGLVAGALASARLHGLEHAIYDAAEVRRRFPALQLATDEVALWEPRAGILRPERCIEAFLKLATMAGATLQYEEPVQSWRATADRVEVSTNQRIYSADQIVFTSGARIARLLGEDVAPVRAERVPVFWMQPAEPALFEPGHLPIYLWETPGAGHFYGFPHLEWPGVKVARHHTGDFCDPDTVDRTVNAHDERLMRGAIEHRIPSLNGAVVSGLVCLYEDSPDEHFLIDHVPGHPNAVYAGGFSGHGFKFASVVGEILADLVATGQATPYADFLKLRLQLDRLTQSRAGSPAAG